MSACVWVGGNGDFDISAHRGSCDLNPKKEIRRVWRRETPADWLERLAVKTHMDSWLRPHWKRGVEGRGALKCIKGILKKKRGLRNGPDWGWWNEFQGVEKTNE